MRAPRALVPLLASCLLLLTACDPATLGIPRVHATATSPDGRHVATVRNHPTIDPPNQSLWLDSDGGPARMVLRLSADQDWCDTIVWAPDSSLVGFLIQDARLVVARPTTGQVVVDAWLVDSPGAYPPPQRAAELEFLPDGSGVSFRPCPAAGGACGPRRALGLPARTPPEQPTQDLARSM
ncbi:MAG: hypothetical protein AB2L07_03905 [Thermoanaerobaculaceae bacterium]